jgi:hypothetical protein
MGGSTTRQGPSAGVFRQFWGFSSAVEEACRSRMRRSATLPNLDFFGVVPVGKSSTDSQGVALKKHHVPGLWGAAAELMSLLDPQDGAWWLPEVTEAVAGFAGQR